MMYFGYEYSYIEDIEEEYSEGGILLYIYFLSVSDVTLMMHIEGNYDVSRI